jgi:hypothetical protein
MADDTGTQNPPPEYPPPHFPTVFADGVSNIANTPTIVKFFMMRFEPSLTSSGPQKPQAFAQVIMPMDGFMATFAFFEAAIKRYLSQGTISEERLNEMRRLNAEIRWMT